MMLKTTRTSCDDDHEQGPEQGRFENDVTLLVAPARKRSDVSVTDSAHSQYEVKPV